MTTKIYTKEWRIIMKKNNKLGWHDICNYVGYIGV